MPYRLVQLAVLFFFGHSLFAQSSADNDPDPTRWINYAQSYFKLPVAREGIYRLTTSELQAAGLPVGQIDPTTVQLFHRGIEQAIFVAGEADHQFDANDFLEFYGRGNDGAQDSLLYQPHSAQPHPYYSLFNDATAYFLTWRLDGQPGRRMQSYMDTTYAGLTAETYHWAEELRIFTDSYPGWAAGIPPKIEYSFYEAGEGYTGPMQQKGKPYTNSFTLTDVVQAGPSPQLDILLAGRSFTDHLVECQVGATTNTQHLLDTVRFSAYANASIRKEISWSDVGPAGQLFVSTLSKGDNGTDAYSASYIRLRYPQKLTAYGQARSAFQLTTNSADRSLVNVTDLLPNPRFWDITDPTAPEQIRITQPTNNSARFVVRGTGTARTIFYTSQPLAVSKIQPVSFINWHHRKPSYLIISHESLMQPIHSSSGAINAVQAYAAYRASAAGGNHDTLTVTMQQLIDQYSYGERSPLAIRRFINQLIREGEGTLQYVLLIGRSRSTPGIRRDPNQSQLDMVMTAGFPGSDLEFTAGLGLSAPTIASANMPAVPTGRINAGTPQDVINYLDKVKEYESLATTSLWRKNILHLSGGETSAEMTLFRNLVDEYRSLAIGQSLGAQVTTVSKATDQLVESINVVNPVNKGVGLITFFGHSGLDVTDLDIGFCSNDALGYQNKGKYPLLLVNGCAIGNFFYGRPTLATDWVLTPNRGAIAAIAHSHLGYPDIMHQYTTTLYNLLTDSTQLPKSIGQLQIETIRRILAQTTDGRALANCQQMVLQGDPAIHLFPFRTPDYAVTPGSLIVQEAIDRALTSSSDSVQIRIVVQNSGQFRAGTLPVRIRRFVNGKAFSVFNTLLPKPVAYQDTISLTMPNERDSEGINTFEVTINPVDSPLAQPETNRTNNQATTELTLAGPSPVLIYPAPTASVSVTAIVLSAYCASTTTHSFELEFDSTARFDSPFRWTRHITATSQINCPASLLRQPNTTYYWRVRLAAKDSAWTTGSFTYLPAQATTGLPEGQIQLGSPLPTDIQQGDIVQIAVTFTNLSPVPFADSLVVRQTVYGADLLNPQTKEWKIRPAVANDTLRFSTRLETEKLPGLNRVLLTINPHLQPEYSFLNNTLDMAFPVQPDTFGPVLEVAVDGARIANGSVVSSRPVIDILVADENRSLLRRDTVGLDLYLQRPGRNRPFERLGWRNASIQPAGADNVFRLRYLSLKLDEGDYHLLVTARDAVGNRAVPYQIGFRVINARSLSDLTISPNPFREQMSFVFTITGEQAPGDAEILLTDMSGRTVRRLHQPVRIGSNEWVWDGRSDAGQLLPAGEYIYKIVLKDPTGWTITSTMTQLVTGRIILAR